MSQPSSKKGLFTQLYHVLSNMSPEKLEPWIKGIIRAVEVEAEVEAELAKEKQAMKGPIEQSESEKNIEYAINILEQMKHTPSSSSQGGSRKRSINCRRPRGFSQRQHCKYGRKGFTRTRRIKLNRSS